MKTLVSELRALRVAFNAAARRRNLSRVTEKTYAQWVRRFVRFHRRHPRDLDEAEVTSFLNTLAVERAASASAQNQALAAILFLYRDVLGRELPWLDGLVRAKKPRTLPIVLSREEVSRVLAELSGVAQLMASLLYGSGLRLLECSRLRVKDIDFDRKAVYVRRGKGAVDRATMLPASLRSPLREHLEGMREQHQRDLLGGAGYVELPDAIARKLPSAAREWPWQWAFPATRHYVHPETRQRRRHHYHETALQRAVTRAVRQSRITKRATCHTFRHSFATHLLEWISPRRTDGFLMPPPDGERNAIRARRG